MPCQVYDGKCVLLNSFRFPDIYFDFLKKCSALHLQIGKFELFGMHALMHFSGPVLPRRLDFVAIHHSMKFVKTICTTDIVNIFYSYTLLLQMYSLCQKTFWQTSPNSILEEFFLFDTSTFYAIFTRTGA